MVPVLRGLYVMRGGNCSRLLWDGIVYNGHQDQFLMSGGFVPYLAYLLHFNDGMRESNFPNNKKRPEKMSSKRRVKAKECTQKRPYKTTKAAFFAARTTHASDGRDLIVYECRWCKNFHVGHSLGARTERTKYE